jgi:hypothetical protein
MAMVRTIEVPVASIDLLPLVAVAAGLLLLLLAVIAEVPPDTPSWLHRATGAIVRRRACRSFANAVTHDEIDAAERHASRAFAWAARSHGDQPATRQDERT